MDVIDTLTINQDSYILVNETNYTICEYLDSSYGFNISFRNRRGIQQRRWLVLLEQYKFDEPMNVGQGIYQAESYVHELRLADFVARPFVIEWTLDRDWYGLGFDGNEFVLQDNEGKSWLPGVIL